MKISIRYGTHLPVLLKVVSLTSGPILELGTGFYSTPLLHFMCLPTQRRLVSYDSDEGWIKNFKDCRTDFHQVNFVEDWDALNITGPWDVVFIDHGPDNRRKTEVSRLANQAKYIILHDSDPENDYLYKYSEIYSQFTYRFDYTDCKPNTTVLSNFIDLSNFTI